MHTHTHAYTHANANIQSVAANKLTTSHVAYNIEVHAHKSRHTEIIISN